MSYLGCFTCLNCGKNNTIKGHSYTNKYCNNSCQQEYQRRHKAFEKVQQWKESKSPQVWNKIPDWIKTYLIEQHGHQCQVCDTKFWMDKPIPLDVIYKDNNSYNTNENNLMLICPNCRAQRK